MVDSVNTNTGSMVDNAELQAKIAAISGKINQHKQQQPPFTPVARPSYGNEYQSQSYRGHDRWSPYGRGGRSAYPIAAAHKHRTLVLNGASTLPIAQASPTTATDSSQLVSARGTNNQLMTKNTYDREQQQKQDHKEQQRASKRQKRNNLEQHRILRHFDSTGATQSRELVMDGIAFFLTDDGAKLVRVPGKRGQLVNPHLGTPLKHADSAIDRETPKRTKVAGIDFYRTKHGNLVRASALKSVSRYRSAAHTERSGYGSLSPHRRPITAKPQCENFAKHGTYTCTLNRTGYAVARIASTLHRTWLAGKSSKAPLTLVLGTCPYGPRCHFAHDPHKVAICKEYLKIGTCLRGGNCDLSHEMTYHRVPACQYFLRGNCTNDACRYPHVHVSPAASVCRAFATLGFCAKGPDCDKRHVHECPDYANSGFCATRESGKCMLPHPDRASILRKAAERQAKMSADADSDISSEENEGGDDLDDIDSDAEDVIMTGSGDSHELSHQQDFVSFA